MKRENGTGSVYKLSGNRRKPWVARISKFEVDKKTQQKVRKYKNVGTFFTEEDAKIALDEYINHPAKYRKCESNIYFISDGNFIKIGKANNIESRLIDLQCGCPYDLTLLKYIHTETEEMAFTLESEIQRFFSEKRCRPVTKKGRPCEWFKVDLHEINEFIKTLHRRFMFQEVGG